MLKMQMIQKCGLTNSSRRAARRSSRTPARCRVLPPADTAQTNAHKDKHRHGKHGHHRKCSASQRCLAARGRAGNQSPRPPGAQQPQHGGARLQMLREVVAYNGEGQREQRSFRHAQQNTQDDHQRVVMGKAHRHHQHAPHCHHPGEQAQRRDFVA